MGRMVTSLGLLDDDDLPGICRNRIVDQVPPHKALAITEWFYIANTGDQPDELYDQTNDPWEMKNPIGHPQGADVAQQMVRESLSRAADARCPVTLWEGGFGNTRLTETDVSQRH